jgi:hypothetical protein
MNNRPSAKPKKMKHKINKLKFVMKEDTNIEANSNTAQASINFLNPILFDI